MTIASAVAVLLLLASGSDGIPVFVRFGRTPTEPEREVLRAHGVNGAAAAATDDELLDAARGARLLVDDLLGPEHLALDDETFERYLDAVARIRAPAHAIRPTCVNRGRRELLRRATEAAAALADREPWGISIVDEPSLARGAAPLEFCHCPACVEAYRGALAAATVGAPELTTDVYGGRPAADGERRPWTVDHVRMANLDRARDEARLGPWLIHRRTLDRTFAAAIDRLCAAVEEESGARAGFLGGAPTNPFGGHDWARLARAASLLGPPDDRTTWRVVQDHPSELRRVVLSTARPTGGDEREAARRVSREFLLGARGVVLPSLDDAVLAVGDEPRPTTLLEVVAARVAALEPAARVLPAGPSDADVGVVYSPDSVKVEWLRRAERYGVRWPTEARSDDVRPHAAARAGWADLLDDLGVGWRSVVAGDLVDPSRPWPWRALVLPRCIVLSDAVVSRIERFVEEGGVVIADAEPALFDGLGRGRAAGGLDALFGVSRPRLDAPWDAPRPPRGRVGSLGLPAVESGLELGPPSDRAIYLNLDVAAYSSRRLSRFPEVRPLLERLRKAFSGAGAEPVARLVDRSGDEVFPIRRRAWTVGDVRYLSLELNVPAADPPPPPAALTLVLETPEHIADVRADVEGAAPLAACPVRIPYDDFVLLRLSPR